jgi:uncharacterized protein with PIN domain
MKRGKKEVLVMENVAREVLKKEIEKSGLECDCGEKVYEVGKGAIEHQSNYNKYFEYLKCTRCQKLYYL